MEQQRSGQRTRETGPFRALLPPLTATVAALAMTIAMAPAATADEDRDAYPSQEAVESAKAEVAQTARDVGAIKAALLLANRRLEESAVQAEQAAEAYNGALWRVELAEQEVALAEEEAAQARGEVAEQRRAIGRLVATSYQQGTELTALSAIIGADGPEGVLDRYASFEGVSASLQADYDRYAAADALARDYERRAEDARQAQQKRAQEARAAKDQATAAASAAQAAATAIAAEKDRLIRELAAAQDISVELARERQEALEQIARERAAARARADAEAAAREQARREAAAAAAAQDQARARAQAAAAAKARQEAAADARKRAEEAREKAAERTRRDAERETDERPTPPAQPPAPQPAPSPPSPPAARGGAGAAIAFAEAQLGEPYQWGAAGPDSWDCSGLMLEAWAQAGVSLPHYSVAQYYAGTPISVGDLRPGDLVFWGTSDDPDSIHHVAMYIGDGQIIHAPRTGRPVSVDSMYYWTPPNFFARV